MKAVLLFAVILTIGLVQAHASTGSTASVVPPNQFGQVTLRYVADPGEANDVSIEFASGSATGIDVTDSGATIGAGAGCTSLSAHKVRCDVSSGDLTNVSLGDGNDILTISKFFDSGGGRLNGGDGDDAIRGNDIAGTNEILLGGRGDDILFGRGGSEFLKGGPGADDLSGGTSCEPLTAGQCYADIDTVSYADRTRKVRATADGIAGDDGQRLEHDSIAADVERIIGGAGNDVLGGTTTNINFADLIPFLAGMQIEGRAGDDRLHGGRGPDSLHGGKGDDSVHGAAGRDRVKGGSGNDRLSGDTGQDRLAGGRGHDKLLANDGQADHVNGGRGFDEAAVDRALDRLRNIERLL
jgi:Ca2+-binding RTX toxin-like protein